MISSLAVHLVLIRGLPLPKHAAMPKQKVQVPIYLNWQNGKLSKFEPPSVEHKKSQAPAVEPGPKTSPASKQSLRHEILTQTESAATISEQLNYASLLPARGISGAEKNSPFTGSKDDPSPGRDSISRQVKDAVQLELFAHEIKSLLSVPLAVLAVMSPARASLRLKKVNTETWEIQSYFGDSFARAILFETITSLKPQSPAFLYLSRSEFSIIRIDFSYQIIQDSKAEPIEIHCDGNRIAITKRYIMPARWLKFLMAQTHNEKVEFGFKIDLLPLIKSLAGERDVEWQRDLTEMQNLRLSPAYKKARWQ